MQQSILLAIRENDQTQLAELLGTAPETEKANAVLLATFTKKIAALKTLIIQGANINRADRDGCTPLHWAVHHNHLTMIELLLAHGATHQENHKNETPTDWAEKNGHINAFNLLVQHFLIVPFKPHQEEELVVDDNVLKKIEAEEPEQKISASTLKLLMQFHIKKNDMDLADIELEDLESVLNHGTLRKFFRFLVSVSTVRTLLLWPFLNTNSIKLYASEKKDNPAIFSDKLLKHATYDFEISEDDDRRLLTVVDEEANVLSDVNPDVQSLLMEDTDNKKMIINDLPPILPQKHLCEIRQTRGCGSPILTTYALPFESEGTQRTVFAITAFHATVEESFDGIWSLLWLSLLIQGIINFYLYPEERLGKTIRDVLGFSSPLNDYQELLAKALISPYILSCVLGIPVLFGAINAIRAARNSETLDAAQVRALIQRLKRHQPGFWSDGLGWVFSALIPDAFPPLAMCSLLPQPAIKQALEKIKQRIIWDGRLSAQEKMALFNQLYRFAHQQSQFTQMKALSMLAAFVDGIDVQNFSLLQEEEVSDENIKMLLFIKARSFKALNFLANHYNLPQVPKSLWRPLFRYLYVNYLMWSLGYPQKWYLQPLFFSYKVVKLYFIFMFYLALGIGISNAVREAVANDVCSLLPDFEYMLHHDPQDCFEGYFTIPKTFETLIEAVKLLPEFRRYVSGVMRIDLSSQKKLIQQKKLPNFLRFFGEVLASNQINVGSLVLKNSTLHLEDMKAIGDFIVNSHKYNGGYTPLLLDLNQAVIESGGISVLVQAAQISSRQYDLGKLILSGIPLNDVDMTALINISLHLNELNLKNCNISSRNCIALAEKLSQKTRNDNLETLNLADNQVNSDCAEIIAQADIRNLDLSGDNRIGDHAIEAFARKFKPIYRRVLRLWPESPEPTQIAKDELIIQVKTDNYFIVYYLGGAHSFSGEFRDEMNIIKRLPPGQESQDPVLIGVIISICRLSPYFDGNYFLSGYNVSDNSLARLFDAMSWLQLKEFHYTDKQVNGLRNYSTLIPKLVQALNQSYIRYFGWTSPGGIGLGDKGVKLFANLIAEKTTKVLGWDFSDNRIGPAGMQILSQAIKFNAYDGKLILRNNHIGSGIIELAKTVVQAKFYSTLNLDFSNNNIMANDIRDFVYLLKNLHEKYSVRSLSFSGNAIGDQGITDLMGLIKESVSSSMALLDFSKTNMSNPGAKEISNNLNLTAPRHLLWIERLIKSNRYNNRAIDKLDVSNNFVDDYGAEALCRAFTSTRANSHAQLVLKGNPINETILQDCYILVSDSHSLKPTSPYFLMYYFSRMLRESFSNLFLNHRNKLFNNARYNENSENNYPDADGSETMPKNYLPKHRLRAIDASRYQSDRPMVITLDSHAPATETFIDHQTIEIPADIIAVRGSITSNNVLIGGDDMLLDVSQSCGTNFLQPGKNNHLRLGFFRDHVVVSENQGLIKVDGFDSKDILHIVAETTVYNDANAAICHNEILTETPQSSRGDSVTAVIDLKGTTVQLFNTQCEDIENNIHINDLGILHAAHVEVMESTTDNTPSILYTHLLGICETFLNSVNQSAWLTAIPIFVREMLYRFGGHTQAEAAKVAEEMQTLLVMGITNSPHAITASLVAGLLMMHLRCSPSLISTVSVGASIATSIIATLMSTNVSLGWVVLQTSFALTGSFVGSLGVQKLPEIARMGFDYANRTKDHIYSSFGFWSRSIELDVQVLESSPLDTIVNSSDIGMCTK